MSTGDVVLTAAAAAVVCGGAGLLVPRVVARLPEPPPDPVLVELAARLAETGSLTERQQRRLDEGPKPLYADVAASPRLGPLCALAAAVVAVLCVLAVGVDRDLAVLLPLVPLGVLLGAVDLRTRMLPARVVQAGLAYAVVAAGVLALVAGDSTPLVRGLVGMAITFLVFAVLWFVYPPGMGYGDVRLSGLVGFVLGHAGAAELLVGVYAAFLLFAVPALGVALVKRSRSVMTYHVPFGPFLLLGIVVGLLVGDPVVSAVFPAA